jgi:hypothetical protein
MEIQRLGTQLSQVTEHKPAPAWKGREHIDRGLDRIRVGIVGVVDKPQARGSEPRLEPAGYRADCGKRGGNGRWVQTQGADHGHDGQSVPHVMPARQMELEG